MLYEYMSSLSNLFSKLEAHFNTTDDIIPVIKILRETELSDYVQSAVDMIQRYPEDVKDTCDYIREQIFSNHRFEIYLISWKTSSFVDFHTHSENGYVFKVLKGEIVEHIETNGHVLKHAYREGDTGYIYKNTGTRYVYISDGTVSLQVYSITY